MLRIDELLAKYPKLNSYERVGWTDYIDYFKFDEVTEPVMVGKDRFGRFYLVIKMMIDNEIFIETFFQRRKGYRGECLSEYLIMGCGHATLLPIETCGGTTKEQFEFIEELLQKGSATLKEIHKPMLCFVDKKVFLYDEKKI